MRMRLMLTRNKILSHKLAAQVEYIFPKQLVDH